MNGGIPQAERVSSNSDGRLLSADLPRRRRSRKEQRREPPCALRARARRAACATARRRRRRSTSPTSPASASRSRRRSARSRLNRRVSSSKRRARPGRPRSARCEPRSTLARPSEEPPPATTGPAEPVAPPRRYVTPVVAAAAGGSVGVLARLRGAVGNAFVAADACRMRSSRIRSSIGRCGRSRRTVAARASAPSRAPSSDAGLRRSLAGVLGGDPTSRAQNARTTGRNSTAPSPACSIRRRRKSACSIRTRRTNPRPHDDFSEPMLEPASGSTTRIPLFRQERRAPPPPLDDDLESRRKLEEEARPPRSYRNLIKAGVVALVFIAVGGLLLWQWPNMVALYSSFRAPAVETVRDTPPAQHAAEDHRPDRARHPAGAGDAGTRRAAWRRRRAEGGAL